MPDWIHDYFERGYAQRWTLGPASEQVRQEAAGLWTLLHLSPGARVLDIGCGHGKHAIPLADRGATVVGLDYAESLLERARSLAAERHLTVRWVRGDMRQLPFRSHWAAAAISMDAFGFFATNAEHVTSLREAARVLSPGGRLAMKVVNGRIILDDFLEATREERDGVVVAISNTLTLDPPRLTQRMRIIGARGEGEYERRQRLYRLEDLRTAFAEAGLTVEGVFAGADGAPFDPATSPAIWIVGRAASAEASAARSW